MKVVELFGEIVSDTVVPMYKLFFGEEVQIFSPGIFNAALREADGDDVEILINSPGGHADAGIAIQSLASAYKGNVIATTIGMAASAATIVAMGASEHRIASNAGMLVHGAMAGYFGTFNLKEMRNEVSSLENYNERIAQGYADRTKATKAEWLEILNDGDDHLFTAEQAMENGLVDSILSTKSDEKITYSDKTLKKSVIEQMPSELKSRLQTYAKKRLDSAKLKNQFDAKMRMMKLGIATR